MSKNTGFELNWKAQTMKTQDQTEGVEPAAGSNSADAGELKGREYAQNAPGAPAKPPKLNAGTLAAGEASKRPEGLLSLPPDLRAFLRSRSVSEIAEVLRLGKGTASRIKRGIYPHTPQKLLKRWDAAKASDAVLVGSWSLRRVLPSATAHEAVLFDGEFYSGAGLVGMRGQQIVVARTSRGTLLAQTLGASAERFPLMQIEAQP